MIKKVSILYIGVSPIMIENLGSHDEIELIVHRNLQAAENYLKTSPKPDAILCDQYLSGGSGMEYHDKLSENQKFNKVAFILLTDEFRKNVYHNAIMKGIDDFFVLPDPSADSLLNRVKFLSEYRHKYPVLPPIFARDMELKIPRSKRLFDLVVAISALLFLSPLLLLVIIAIRLESKGKVYYISKRFGQSKIFDFYKLRSMRTGSDAEIDKMKKEKNQYSGARKQLEIDFSNPCRECEKLPAGEKCSTTLYIHGHEICQTEFKRQEREIAKTKSAFVKVLNDPRVTRVGKFIRKTSIDELPQLINVIKGDMSIVGNRPLPIYEVEHLLKDWETQMAMRCLAPAGITGLWQIKERGKGGEEMSEEERKNYDIEYAAHLLPGKYSFWYDLKLVLQTFTTLFQKDSV